MTSASVVLHGGAAAVCLVWTALVLAVGRGVAPPLLGFARGDRAASL